MSDSITSAIADSFKDIGKEAAKQVLRAGPAAVKSASQQIVGYKTQEEEEKEKAEKMATFQRRQQIEAEIAQIRIADEKKRQTQATNQAQQATLDTIETGKSKKMDEASRQAVGRAEQGRNFKG